MTNPCRICGEPAKGKFCAECEARILARVEDIKVFGPHDKRGLPYVIWLAKA